MRTQLRGLGHAASAFVAVIVLAGAASAASIGDPRAGREMAEQACAECHEVLAGRESTAENRAASFQEIADTPGITRLSLTVFFQTPHRNMPNLVLRGNERDDLIAYILSLKAK